MEDERGNKKSVDHLYSLAVGLSREGVPPEQIEAALVERGVSPEMAALTVAGLSGPSIEVDEADGRADTRGFGNLHLDAWRVALTRPYLFLVLPVLVWFPFNLFAEYATQAHAAEGAFSHWKLYTWLSRPSDVLVGAWLAAVLLAAIRRMAGGSPISVAVAVREGSRRYKDFLKTTWSVSWRVWLATMALLIPGIVLSIRYLLAIPITAFEDASGVDATRRSGARMRGRSWKLFGYTIGFFLVYVPWIAAIYNLMPDTDVVTNALTTIPVNILLTLWLIWLALVYMDTTGNRKLAPPIRALEVNDSFGNVRRGAPRGRKRLAVTTLLGIAVLVLSYWKGPDVPPFDGPRINFGENQQYEIYYDNDVEQWEAWRLGQALVYLEWFTYEEQFAVRLGADDKRYWLYFYVPEDPRSDTVMMEYLSWAESFLSEVMEKPTRIVTLVPTLSGPKEIPVSREVRPLHTWDQLRDSTRYRPLPAVSSVSRPALELAIQNQEVTRWVNECTDICGPLFPWSFEYLDTEHQTLDPEKGRDIVLLVEEQTLDVLRSTFEWSPSDEFTLTMFVHNLNRESEGWNPHRLEPERWLYLFRVSDGKGWPVLVAGPSTRLYALGWTDERTSVVLGTQKWDDADCLCIWVLGFDGQNVNVERHRGPTLTGQQRDELENRWPAWLRSHYSSVAWGAE